MAMQVSGSIVHGSGYINHNERKFTRGNVDRERTKDNIQIMDETEEQAYKKLFADTIEEYNITQKRADRKKTVAGYHEEITNNKHKKGAEKPFYEVIIQIGDKETCHCINNPEEAERAKQALLKYTETWNARNPNLKIFNATLHMDEATPSLHIDYIPVATGYKQGLKVRNSLSKALENQGLVSTKQQHDNASMKWLEQERTALKEIGKEYDFQIVEQGISREHLSVAEFKKVQDKLNRELEKQKAVELKPIKLLNIRTLSKEDYETVQKTNDIVAKKEFVLDEMTSRVAEQQANVDLFLRAQKEKARQEERRLQDDRKTLDEERKQFENKVRKEKENIDNQREELNAKETDLHEKLVNKIEMADVLYNRQLSLNKDYEQARSEITRLKQGLQAERQAGYNQGVEQSEAEISRLKTKVNKCIGLLDAEKKSGSEREQSLQSKIYATQKIVKEQEEIFKNKVEQSREQGYNQGIEQGKKIGRVEGIEDTLKAHQIAVIEHRVIGDIDKPLMLEDKDTGFKLSVTRDQAKQFNSLKFSEYKSYTNALRKFREQAKRDLSLSKGRGL